MTNEEPVGRDEFESRLAALEGRKKDDAELLERMNACSEPLLRFFWLSGLPEYIRHVLRPWSELALETCETIPRNAERTVALRKLLEGRDAVARALITADLEA